MTVTCIVHMRFIEIPTIGLIEIISVQPMNLVQKESTENETPQAWPEDSRILPKYALRDISSYPMVHDKKSYTHYNSIKPCLPYKCTNNSTICDTMEATDYLTSNPPCCVHILRDMAKTFDDEMVRLGLDYAAGFGTLLGLRRADKLIPWTADNDYILETQQISNAMVDLWNETSTGLAIIFDYIPRMCATKDFAGGLLKEWEVPVATNDVKKGIKKGYNPVNLFTQGYPYIDLYAGTGKITKPARFTKWVNDTGGKDYISVLQECLHWYKDIFPTKRVGVYSGAFAQNVPANTDVILEDNYGFSWRIPKKEENAHGSSHCVGSGYRKPKYGVKVSKRPQEQKEVVSWPELPKYSLRDISLYPEVHDFKLYAYKDSNATKPCLTYQCTNNVTICDTMEATDYSSSNPPCCIHILRDMARMFDKEMVRLGLDYTAGFGTLLGLRRADKLIPWTIDNDYIVETIQVSNAMADLWNKTSTGIAIVYDDIPRMCATKDFAGGLLKQWEVPVATNYKKLRGYGGNLFNKGYPYIDLYAGKGKMRKPLSFTKREGDTYGMDYFSEITECLHWYKDMFPTKRVSVYGGAFAQNVPANTDSILQDKYGSNWRTPKNSKTAHGDGPCKASHYWKYNRRGSQTKAAKANARFAQRSKNIAYRMELAYHKELELRKQFKVETNTTDGVDRTRLVRVKQNSTGWYMGARM